MHADSLEVAQSFAINATAGQIYAWALDCTPWLLLCMEAFPTMTSVCPSGLIVTDALSNSTIGVFQGFDVPIITQRLAQAVYTLTTAEGSLQVCRRC